MIARLRLRLALHRQNLTGAIARLASQPFATAMTVLVIAIAIALPAGLRVLVDNLGEVGAGWERAAEFSVYLEPSVDAARAEALTGEVSGRDDVAVARLVTRAEALAEFRVRSGFGDALDALEDNPLPHVIVVRPAGGAAADLDSLAGALEAMPEVDFAQLDTQWVERWRAILELASRIVNIVAAALGLGVVLVIGNTIRLEINNRAAEIEVVKLVGGTDGFVRRPFLYLGFCYGLAGAAVAAALIGAALTLLDGPASRLAELYDSGFRLAGPTLAETALLLGGGALLGWAGAALATARHLRAIEPR